jgi:hypothetical protein
VSSSFEIANQTFGVPIPNDNREKALKRTSFGDELVTSFSARAGKEGIRPNFELADDPPIRITTSMQLAEPLILEVSSPVEVSHAISTAAGCRIGQRGSPALTRRNAGSVLIWTSYPVGLVIGLLCGLYGRPTLVAL